MQYQNIFKNQSAIFTSDWSSVSSDTLNTSFYNYDWSLFQFGATCDNIAKLISMRIKATINYYVQEKWIVNKKHSPGMKMCQKIN